VWADAREDGSAPNNWLSLFGGSAWQWEPRRGQYYLHNFLASQPDLNFHHPQVRAAALDSVRFWLDKGVDGVRLDAINFCFHDSQLRDNPPKPKEKRVGRGFSPDNPYAFQYHYYNNTQPENLAFLGELRALMDGYPDVAALGEISSEDSLATMAEYTSGHRLHMGYSFELLTDDFSARISAARCRTRIADDRGLAVLGHFQPRRGACAFALGQGQGRRAAGQPAHRDGLFAARFGLRLPGRGARPDRSRAAFESLQDPYGIAFWPQFKGRDGCRTPMPWSDDAHAGFSAARRGCPCRKNIAQLAVSPTGR
jgi:alpha-glucosidase